MRYNFVIYVRQFDGLILQETRTLTPDPDEALKAFHELLDRSDFDGQRLIAVLRYKNEKLALHQFNQNPGDEYYFKDKVSEIEWPPGLEPVGIGGGKRVNVYLDAEMLDVASSLGSGNVSEGIRIALSRAS